MNSFFSFNKYKKYFFSIFGCWLLPEKNSVCPKNDGYAQLGGGAAASPALPAASTPMLRTLKSNVFCHVVSKDKKKKGQSEGPLVGPWIQRLHLADNGIDATCSGDCEYAALDRNASLVHCVQMIGQ